MQVGSNAHELPNDMLQVDLTRMATRVKAESFCLVYRLSPA
jgi:hypothetical protein